MATKIDLRQIDPREYNPRFRTLTAERILAWFRSEGAFWQYAGEPSPDRPHAELTSGMCSNGFIDCLLVLRYPNVAEALANFLAWRLRSAGVGEVDWVVSSSYAAITFGHEVAKALGAIFMMTEKDPADPRRQVWSRMTIPAGAKVLQAEELITTSGTFQGVFRAVRDGNPKPVIFISTVGALIHRPPKLPVEYDGRRVVALVEREIQSFDPEKCPYCRVGSPRLRPKTHWSQLTSQ